MSIEAATNRMSSSARTVRGANRSCEALEIPTETRSNPVQLSVRRAAVSAKAPQRVPQQINLKKITGFGPLARITTSFGEVYAQALRKGDMVRTTGGAFARIEHVDRLHLDEGFLHRHPSVQPIRIRRGSLGPNLPAQDVILAPYQMIRPGPARVMTKMVPAAELMGKPFVSRATENQITYTRIYFTKATSGFCEGLATDF